MQRAHLLSCVVLLVLAASCSSGLGDAGPRATAQPATSTNLRFGFDPGFVLTDPIRGVDVAGGTLPGLNGGQPRPVSFLAFVTNARADDGDGAGMPLDRSSPPPADGASTADVFLAAVAADLIDTRAFVYAIAGKMRHPRCTTCHSMNSDPTTAFATAEHTGVSLPVGTLANCGDCHEVDDWRSPPDSLDLRGESAGELFVRAQQAINTPTGPSEHFETDPRVLWALGSDGGLLPFNNVADDDHDGVLEPEDTDGKARTVPGGTEDFLDRLRGWKESGQKFDSKDAVRDIVLVSRAFGANSAGNGDSFAPSAHYRVNPAFTAGSDPDVVPVGFVRIAFASEATDLVGGATNNATDVFQTDVEVFHRSDGSIDLAVDTASQVLVSAGFNGEAQGESNLPDLGGANGERVAFLSTAPNLVAGFVDANGAEPDVYVAEPDMGLVQLASHVPGSQSTGGNGRSSSPSMDPSGSAVVFQSSASDLVPSDTNGVQDIFFATIPDLFVQRASVANLGAEAGGGDSFEASIFVFPGTTDVRVAYASNKTNLVPGPLPGSRNVYLFDSRAGGTTTLLNRIAGPAGSQVQPSSGANQDAGAPILGPDGLTVLFESMSADIDFVRPGDDNHVRDVMLADLRLLETDGFVLPYTLSVAPDGGSANGASRAPRLAALAPADDGFPLGVAVFFTGATNLSNPDVTGDTDMDGVPDSDNLLLMFLREGATVVADFEAVPEKQGMGLEVEFKSTSSGKPTEFLWDFGDGDTSTEQSPKHVYEDPGQYTVTMEARGTLGEDVRVREDYVRVLGPVESMFATTKDALLSGVVQDPADNVPNGMTVNGAIDPDNQDSMLRFLFDSSTSTECPDEFEWLLTEIDPINGPGTPVPIGDQDDPTVEATLAERGMFEVSLAASGPGGQGASATQTIQVWNRVLASFTALTAITGDAPLTVTFQDTSQGDVESLRWERDGTPFSTVAQPTETFGEGVFQVRLVTRGLGGDQNISSALQITSFGDLTASFTPATLEEIRNTTRFVSFTNTSMGTPGVDLAFFWDFDNGSTSTEQTPPVQAFTVSTENRTEYDVMLVASTAVMAPADCGGLGSTECSEASATFRFFPPITSNVSVSASSTQRRQITMTPSVLGDGTGTAPSYIFLRSAPGGLTPNITLGTFSTSAERTFTISELGVYRFALRVETDAPNGGRQEDTSPSVIQEVFADFSTDVFPIMSNNCLSCHTAAPSCAGNGNLSYADSTAGTVFNRIVDQPASNCTGCQGQPLIDGNGANPNNSLMFRKLSNNAGGCGGVMPPASSGLSQADRDVFSSWIRGGAVF